MLLFWSMSNPMSMILFNFLGSVCNFGCIFCLCMSMRLSFPVYSILLFCLVSVWCVFGWLSTLTQSRLLSMTIERRGGCGAGEPGYLAAFPASLCPGHLVVVIVSLSCRWTTVLDLVVVYPTNTHVYSELCCLIDKYQGHLLLFHSCLHCYCRNFEVASETWSKPCTSAPCQVLFPLQRWFDGTYRLLSRQPSSF